MKTWKIITLAMMFTGITNYFFYSHVPVWVSLVYGMLVGVLFAYINFKIIKWREIRDVYRTYYE